MKTAEPVGREAAELVGRAAAERARTCVACAVGAENDGCSADRGRERGGGSDRKGGRGRGGGGGGGRERAGGEGMCGVRGSNAGSVAAVTSTSD